MPTATPTCSTRSTSSRSDQFPARESLPSSLARSCNRVAATNLSTLVTIPMWTMAMGGSFGCHLSRRTPGGIGGGVPLSLNNPFRSSRFCLSSGTSHAARLGIVYLIWPPFSASDPPAFSTAYNTWIAVISHPPSSRYWYGRLHSWSGLPPPPWPSSVNRVLALPRVPDLRRPIPGFGIRNPP